MTIWKRKKSLFWKNKTSFGFFYPDNDVTTDHWRDGQKSPILYSKRVIKFEFWRENLLAIDNNSLHIAL